MEIIITFMNDEDVISLIRRDPDKGMRFLVKEYTRLLYSVVNPRLCHAASDGEIEDIVSEAFSDFYFSVGRMDFTKGTVKSYLCTIAKNKAAKRYLEIRQEAENVSLEEEDFTDDFSLEDEYVTDETRKALVKAISELEKTDCEIIVRKFYLGETSKSISERLGISIGALDMRVHRALKKIKEKLEKENVLL